MSAYVVVVDMVVRPDAEEHLSQIFSGPFSAAISVQEGFRSVALLKPLEGQGYALIITFSERSLQERWVATDLHTEVWSAMEATCSRCDVRLFHTV
jgi:heme-degrading monooxygenase HmoA